jgi:hypothetical protein
MPENIKRGCYLKVTLAYKGWKIRPMVQQLLETSSIDLKSGAGIPELTRFQDHFREYKIVVYAGLNCDSVMFQGQVESEKRMNLLCDEVTDTITSSLT